MSKSKRRGAGEGLIRLRKDGRWEARISLGWEAGKRLTRSYFGASMPVVQDKLLKARTDHSAGLPVKVEKQTVGEFLQHWTRDAVAPSVRALTLEQYQQHVRLYLVPAFGRIPLRKLYPADIQRFMLRALPPDCRRARCA